MKKSNLCIFNLDIKLKLKYLLKIDNVDYLEYKKI